MVVLNVFWILKVVLQTNLKIKIMKTKFQFGKMKINLATLGLFLFTSFSFAQTKLIAHKSHSGTKMTFRIAYEHNLFQLNQSNFGLPGNKNIVLLDSVIVINDSVTLLKLRESVVCFPFNTNYKNVKPTDFNKKTIQVINHKVFNKKNTITTIKSMQYFGINFSNSIDEVVFIGFKKK